MSNESPTRPQVSSSDAGSETKIDIDREELKSVKEVLVQLTKATKTCKLYFPNNPIYQKSLQELYNRFIAHVEEYGEMKLTIQQYQFLYHGQPVYKNTNPLESLAFKLYVDGLRGLSFSESVELDEITGLLEVIGRKHDPENPDDDIVTLLWERRFKHIHYLVSGDFIHETANEPTAPDPPAMQGMIQKETSGSKPVAVDSESVLKESLGIHLEGGTIKGIFELTEDEAGQIKHEMAEEEGSDLAARLLQILTEIIRIEKNDASFAESVHIFDGLLATFIARGDLVYAVRILKLYHELLSPAWGLSDHHQGCLRNSFKQLSEPHLIKDLERMLDQRNHIGTEQFSEFLVLLGGGSIDPLLGLLGGLTQARARRSLCDVLINLCKDNVEPLLGHLEDSRPQVVKDVLYILGKIGDPKSLDRFRQLVTHEKLAVRRELVNVLDAMQDAKSRELLMMFFHDSDVNVRLQVARSLANVHYEPAQQAFFDIINGKDFLSKDLTEKKEWFQALARIGGNGVVPLFGRFLKEGMGGWLKRPIKEEMALCAVEGLRRIGSEESRAILAEGQQASNKRIRNACTRVLERRTG